MTAERDWDDDRAFGRGLTSKAIEAEERTRTLMLLRRISAAIGVPIEDLFAPAPESSETSDEPESKI